jgi:hypothetical protein
MFGDGYESNFNEICGTSLPLTSTKAAKTGHFLANPGGPP